MYVIDSDKVTKLVSHETKSRPTRYNLLFSGLLQWTLTVKGYVRDVFSFWNSQSAMILIQVKMLVNLFMDRMTYLRRNVSSKLSAEACAPRIQSQRIPKGSGTILMLSSSS